MITAQEARDNMEKISSQVKQLEQQREKTRFEGLLNQAISEEMNKNSTKVSRTLDRGSDLHAEIIRTILREKGFKNISVESKYESHDRYVDSRVDINFSF